MAVIAGDSYGGTDSHCSNDLFGGEANWGLISGWETAKLEIMKWSNRGNVKFLLRKSLNGQTVKILMFFCGNHEMVKQ